MEPHQERLYLAMAAPFKMAATIQSFLTVLGIQGNALVIGLQARKLG